MKITLNLLGGNGITIEDKNEEVEMPDECEDCGIELTPENQSSDPNLCKECKAQRDYETKSAFALPQLKARTDSPKFVL